MTGAGTAERELPRFARRTLGLFTRRSVPWDRVVPVRPFSSRFLLTRPEDVRHVLMDGEGYRKTPRITGERGRERVGEGLLARRGRAHRARRRLLQRFFHRRAVRAHDGTIRAVVDAWIEERSAGERLDLAAGMEEMTRTVILRILFGDDLPDGARRRLSAAIADRRRYTEHLYHGRMPFRDRLPTPIVRANRRAVATLEEAIQDAVDRRRSEETDRDDLVADLVGVTDEEGRGLSDRDVRDEVLTFTTTGYETLGELLTWSWHLLAEHPEVERALHEEVDAGGGEPAPRGERRGEGAGEDGGEPSTVRGVIDEALRLYPPTWIYARIPTAPDRLPGGREVGPDDTLYVCPWLLHRHPAHFEEPERFDPTRFRGRQPPRFVYLPFGDGPHRCLGEHLVEREARTALARIGRRWRFRPLEPGPVEPRGGVTLRPRDGLPVEVEAR